MAVKIHANHLRNKKTQVYSIREKHFVEMKNEGRKLEYEKTRVYAQKPRVKMSFKNSISGVGTTLLGEMNILWWWSLPFSLTFSSVFAPRDLIHLLHTVLHLCRVDVRIYVWFNCLRTHSGAPVEEGVGYSPVSFGETPLSRLWNTAKWRPFYRSALYRPCCVWTVQ